jgi:hypothetical protein
MKKFQPDSAEKFSINVWLRNVNLICIRIPGLCTTGTGSLVRFSVKVCLKRFNQSPVENKKSGFD